MEPAAHAGNMRSGRRPSAKSDDIVPSLAIGPTENRRRFWLVLAELFEELGCCLRQGDAPTLAGFVAAHGEGLQARGSGRPVISPGHPVARAPGTCPGETEQDHQLRAR